MHPNNLIIAALFQKSATEQDFRAHCGALNGHRMDTAIGTLADVQPSVRRFAASDVLLLDIDPTSPDQMAQLATVVTEFPATPVIATAPQLSAQDIRKILHLGVADVLPQPLGEDDLLIALRQAMRSRMTPQTAPGPRRGRKVAFLKSAGGAGATTMAVQAGCILATAGKHRAAALTCLLDFDIQQAGTGLHLDLAPCDQLVDLAATPDRMDDALLEGLLTYHASGLGVLTAPQRIMPLDMLTSAFVTATIDTAARAKSYVLIDLPSAWIDWKLAALQSVDIALMVTELTVPGIHGARVQLETLAEQGLGDLPVHIIANRADAKGGVSIKQAEKALERPVAYRVHNDWALVSEAVNQGVALAAVKRRSKVEKTIHHFVDGAIRAADRTGARAEPHLARADATVLEVR